LPKRIPALRNEIQDPVSCSFRIMERDARNCLKMADAVAHTKTTWAPPFGEAHR